MQKHTSAQFDAELNDLGTKVLEMGHLVKEQFRFAVASMISGDTSSLLRYQAEQETLDHLKHAIEEACDVLLVRRQPTAVDMRTVVAIIRISNELERLSVHARKIAAAAQKISVQEREHLPRYRELKHAANIALDMVHHALEAFAQGDPQAAARLELQDEEVNSEYPVMMRHLISFMMEDPSMVSSSVEIMVIAGSIERIGDHAKNVAEQVRYMIQGRQRAADSSIPRSAPENE